MARVLQSYRFTTANPYTDDRGVVRQLTARFVVPPDMSAAQAIGLAAAAGGVAVLPGDPKTICPDPGVQGRKLTFFRQNGNSVSLTIGDRLTLIAQATTIRAALNALTATNPVVCIKLDGEYFPNLFDELAPAVPGARVPGVSSRPPAAAGKQHIYSGVTGYLSDAVYGREYFLPFKIASDSPGNVAPTEYASLLTLGNIAAQNIGGCPGKDPRTTRRYIIQSVVTQNAATISQTAEIPVGLHLPADINSVGVAAAALTSTQCLGYIGEGNSRFHKLLP